MTASGITGALQRYSGSLTPAEIAEGMNVAQGNAKRLASDARILFEAGRYPTAASLAALAIEEAGKVTLLRTIAVAADPTKLKTAWKEYRSHRAKNQMWVLPEYAARGARHLRDFAGIVEKDADHTALLDAIKQIGFYTDCYSRGHWSSPQEVIEADLARSVVTTAEILSRSDMVHTAREVELWIFHLGPVWEKPGMREAIVRWHAALVEEGLNTSSQADFERFILGREAPNSPNVDKVH
jgi:AbiV family abortive infection protein